MFYVVVVSTLLSFYMSELCTGAFGCTNSARSRSTLIAAAAFNSFKSRRSQQAAATAAQQDQQQVPLAFIKLAHDLADAAGKVTSAYFRSSTLNVDSKSDASPVTIADRQAETAMRHLIKETVPQHSVFGEEHGLELGSSNGSSDSWLWVLDPIDGTKSFITGAKNVLPGNTCLATRNS